MITVNKSRNYAEDLQKKVRDLVVKLQDYTADNEDLRDFINQVIGRKDIDDDDEDDGDNNDDNGPDEEAKFNSQTLTGSKMNLSFRITQIDTKSKVGQANRFKAKNRRSKESIGFGKAWGLYVSKVANTRYVRDLTNEEQNDFANFIYDELTAKILDQSDDLNIYSLKNFITTSIDYVYDCDKETYNIYLIICTFKMLANLTKK